MQVHVQAKGFAASQSGDPVYVSTSLDTPISASAQGSLGGGWPIQFNSTSNQLGKQPTRVYLRFMTASSSSLAEVYMLPDPGGYTDRLHAILCARPTNGSTSAFTIPDLPFLGLQHVEYTGGREGRSATQAVLSR